MRPSLHEPRVDDQGREEEEKTSANIPRIFLEEEGEVRERESWHGGIVCSEEDFVDDKKGGGKQVRHVF